MNRIVIIGGGPAGYEAALVAAQYGAEVVVVEAEGLGGACVLYDCVPSKTFISSAGVRADLRRATDLGVDIDLDKAAVEVPVVHGRVRALALAQSADIRARLQREGVQIIPGRAKIVDTVPGMARHRIAVDRAD
ncbi:MAG: FAD-dependent oxidoreductase, partial [Mycobacteriaceae bacterium]